MVNLSKYLLHFGFVIFLASGPTNENYINKKFLRVNSNPGFQNYLHAEAGSTFQKEQCAFICEHEEDCEFALAMDGKCYLGNLTGSIASSNKFGLDSGAKATVFIKRNGLKT